MQKVALAQHLPLNALRAFEMAARYQSISRASDELCVTQAAVSQQIAQLEDRLGVALFTRHHRRIELTDPGRSLSVVLQRSFEQIQVAVQSVKRNKQNRVLKLVLYPTLATRWLLPKLARFHSEYPDLDVQVTTSMQLVDFVNDDVDFSIQYGDQIPPNVESMPIISEVLMPVCSPKLLAGKKLELADLTGYTLIHSTNRLTDWNQWLEHCGVHLKPEGGEMFVGNSYLAYQAAIDGLGMAMAQQALVQQDVAEGRLVAPFPERFHTKRTYHLTYLASRRNMSQIVSFREWILSELARESAEMAFLAEPI
jgi:LysR family glycine cleavage system transcriptional activator